MFIYINLTFINCALSLFDHGGVQPESFHYFVTKFLIYQLFSFITFYCKLCAFCPLKFNKKKKLSFQSNCVLLHSL